MTVDSRRGERDAIMRAAFHLIGHQETSALSPTSIENILRVAGVNRRTFYRHFTSKDDLVIAMLEWAGGQVLSKTLHAVENTGNPADAVAAWIGSYLQIGWTKAAFHDALAIMSSDVVNTPGVAAALEATYARHRAVLAQVLASGRADGSFPGVRPDLDAFAIQAVCVRHIEARIRGMQDTAFDDVCDHVVTMMLAALSTRRDR